MIKCFWLEPTGEQIIEDRTTYPLYRRVDTGEVKKTISAFGVGAMWDAPWYHDGALPEAEIKAKIATGEFAVGKNFLIRRHADERVLVVMTPGGEWVIDQISAQGNFWTRTGVPPNITAHPSIHIIGRYHGWLRNGELVPA